MHEIVNEVDVPIGCRVIFLKKVVANVALKILVKLKESKVVKHTISQCVITPS